ncbi:gamma-2-syntrophin-like [Mya arenaria]|uniref:gamma-2-syntrophin-like n=1 Tax=Mya arenaria TaxID=6604 RepID=UPI0022E0C3C2|nr:gamma-2-syntrophin-like [Mya arenaria]
MASPNEAKVGFATLCESRSLGEVVQLKLTAEVLVLLREEYVPREPPAEENGNESILEVIRTVELRREREGGLGLSVKGGQEHKLPALISRIVPNQAAAKTQQLFVGDAILKVNGENIEAYSHDQVIETLRSAGDVVTLSVKYFKPAAVFLNKSSNSADLNENDGTVSPPGVIVPRLEKSWVIYSSIPLLYANLTRYRSGTDKLRSNAFELVGVDGTTSGVLQFDDNHSLAEWMAAITNNINSLLTQMVKMMNRLLLPEEQIEFMGWSQQRGSPGTNAQPWSPKFIALKGPDIHLFDMPPMQARDWERCDTVFHVYECMFKILQDSELVDDKQNCCSVQTTSKETIYLSLESRAELLQLERAWYRTNHGAIARLKTKTFGCTYQGRLSGIILDLDVGFSLYDSGTKTYLWTYKFSRLKGSSDDGKQRLKLHFSTDTPGQVDAKEVECSSLQLLLFCIHAFLSAKLASVDPSFLANY